MTVTLTTERQYIEALDCALYISKYDGKFTLADCFGCKSYKTLSALNKMLAKCCDMKGIAHVEAVA